MVGRDFADQGDFLVSEYDWDAHATRAVPEESLSSIRLASKRLIMLLAGNLAKEVAAILDPDSSYQEVV